MDTTPENLEATEVVAPVQAAPVFASAPSNVELGSLSFNALREGGARQLEAALADQTTTKDAGKLYIRDQEVGEVWEARKVERPLASAVTNKTLSSLVVAGQRKQRTFVVADWAGNKTEIPSSTFTTSSVTETASALAGAVDVAMELIEFGSADVLSDIYEQAADSYAVKSEVKLLTKVRAGATSVTAAYSTFAAVDYAVQTLAGIGARVDTIQVAPNVYSRLMTTNSANAPWWLAAQGNLNLGGSSATAAGVSLKVNPNLAANEVIVLDSRAVTLYESKDIKFKALDLPRGGVDISFIKFHAILVNDPKSVLRFTAVSS